MASASDQLYKTFVRRSMARFASMVKVRDLLLHLPSFTQSEREEVEMKREMTGNYNAMQLLFEHLKRRDNWPEEFIRALEKCELAALAQEMRDTYEALKSNGDGKPEVPGSPGAVVTAHVHSPPTAVSVPDQPPVSASSPSAAAAAASEPVESPLAPSSPAKSSLPPSETTEPSSPAKAAPETLVTPDATSQPAPPPDAAAEAESTPPAPDSTPPTGAEIPEVLQTSDTQAPDVSAPSESDVPDGPTHTLVPPAEEPPCLSLGPQPPTEEAAPVSPELTKAPIKETSPPGSSVDLLPEPEETSDSTMHQISTEEQLAAPPEVQTPPPTDEVQPPPPKVEEAQPTPPEDGEVQPPPKVEEAQPPPPKDEEVQPPPPKVEEVQPPPPEVEEVQPPPPEVEEVQPPPDMQIITPPAPAPAPAPVVAMVHQPPPSPVASDVEEEEEESLTKPEVPQSVTEESSPSLETQPPEPSSVTSGDLNISPPAEPAPQPETTPSLTEANGESATVKENGSPSHQPNGLLDDQAPSPHHTSTEEHSGSLCSSSLTAQEQSTPEHVVLVAQDPSIQNQDGQEQSMVGDVVSSEDSAIVNHSDTQSEPTTNHHSVAPSPVGSEVHVSPVKEEALAPEDTSCTKTELILQAREREAQEEENKHQENGTSPEEEQGPSPLAGLLPAIQNAPLLPAAAAVGVCALVFAWKLSK